MPSIKLEDLSQFGRADLKLDRELTELVELKPALAIVAIVAALLVQFWAVNSRIRTTRG